MEYRDHFLVYAGVAFWDSGCGGFCDGTPKFIGHFLSLNTAMTSGHEWGMRKLSKESKDIDDGLIQVFAEIWSVNLQQPHQSPKKEFWWDYRAMMWKITSSTLTPV